jgi:hypothetical protein
MLNLEIGTMGRNLVDMEGILKCTPIPADGNEVEG